MDEQVMHPYVYGKLRELAQARNAVFVNMRRNRPLSSDYEEVGVIGEWEFGRFCGLMPKTRTGGDGGVDFELPVVFTVDVKTSKRGDCLLVEAGKVKADIYVLVHYKEVEADGAIDVRGLWSTGKGELVGWAFATFVKTFVPSDTGRGIVNHTVPREQLRPMVELERMMGKVKRG